ncbi:carbon-nitrogen hydrolase family protein [Shimia abyssi]|uniref:Putative amidohydrolase n=1 Tax=Shimia abyssi TaxID=1662395 RepID=A0A2P8F7V5_9RHOB|nr:carbon-nitrogen hydrolase family protein [Shimia abyssi]PSL17804.1 putative amidohydrolase [Shimia abyssi]
MKIATAGYPLDFLDSWAAYEDKLHKWVSTAAGQGADLLVFPEYGAMELATLAGEKTARDLEQSLYAVSDRMPEADSLYSQLAKEFDVYILGASAPVFDGGTRPVNRARLFSPNGNSGFQDKQIMTRFETSPWDVVPGSELKVFDTALGKIGVLICYDCEFPLLGHALVDCDIVLTPSCTETLTGYWRVRIGSMARALENQCVTAMASLVGPADWSQAVDMNTGMGGIFGPPDTGFPPTGVINEGTLNQSGWVYAEVDPQTIAEVRANGVVRNRWDWVNQSPRDSQVTYQHLS